MSIESAPKPHVAFLASPGIGHITPLFELASRLVTQHNFQVSFIVIANGSTPAQTEYLNANSHPDLHIVDLPVVNMTGLLTDDMSPFASLCVIAQESICSLPSVLSGIDRPKLRALVIDIFCTGVFETCKEVSIPVYSFFTSSAALLAYSLYLPALDTELNRGSGVLPDTIEIPGCHSIRTWTVIDERNEDYKLFLHHVSRLPMATGIFVNSWDDLEPVWLRALKHEPYFLNIPTPPVYPIGPLMKQDDPAEAGKEIIEWLDKQPKESVLFVTLGSGGTLTSEQLTELAWGLGLSQQRFILVVRKPSDCANAALLNAGSETENPEEYLPDGFLNRTKGVGLVVSSWAPQMAVLSHQSTGAFLSHCGWNSTLESCVKHGVPMIAWPMYAEQWMTATILSDEVGVAVKMPVVGESRDTVVVGRKEIERVVRMVFEGGEGRKMRNRASELKASGEVTLSCQGSSFQTLAKVTESWKVDN